MSLLDGLTNVGGHVTEALVHFSHALGMSNDHPPKVEVARILFDALNKLQTEWLMSQADQQLGESPRVLRRLQTLRRWKR